MKKNYILTGLAEKYYSDNIGRFSAALSYYMIFSFFPILIVTSILIARLGINPAIVETTLKGIVPQDIAYFVRNYLEYAQNYGGLKILFISGFFTLYFPVRFIENLMAGINIAYGLNNNRKFFCRYAIVFLFVIIGYIVFGMAFASLAIGKNVFATLMKLFYVPIETINIWQQVQIVILFAAMFLSITALYYISPCTKLKLKDVLIGSSVSSVSWFVVSMVFSYYAENLANYSILYGSIAVVMILLYWLFLTALILLMGAELNSILYYKKHKRTEIG